MIEKFKKIYSQTVAPSLIEIYSYTNPHEVPQIKKIQINLILAIKWLKSIPKLKLK